MWAVGVGVGRQTYIFININHKDVVRARKSICERMCTCRLALYYYFVIMTCLYYKNLNKMSCLSMNYFNVQFRDTEYIDKTLIFMINSVQFFLSLN